MTDGDLRTDQQRVQRAVGDAETVTGMQFTVVFCLDGDGMHEQADRTFEALGLTARPAVLLLVEPMAGSFDIEVAPRARLRVTESTCAEAVETMTTCFDETSDLAACIEQGLGIIAAAAGRPDGDQAMGPALPDVLLVTPQT